MSSNIQGQPAHLTIQRVDLDITNVQLINNNSEAEVTLSNGSTYVFTVLKGSQKATASREEWIEIARKTINVLKENGLPIRDIQEASIHLTKGHESIVLPNIKDPIRAKASADLSALQQKVASFGPPYIATNLVPSLSGETATRQPQKPVPQLESRPLNAAPLTTPNIVVSSHEPEVPASSSEIPAAVTVERLSVSEPMTRSRRAPVRDISEVSPILTPTPPGTIKINEVLRNRMDIARFKYRKGEFTSIEQACQYVRFANKGTRELIRQIMNAKGRDKILEVANNSKNEQFVDDAWKDNQIRQNTILEIVEAAANDDFIFKDTIMETGHNRIVNSDGQEDDFTRALTAYREKNPDPVRDRTNYLSKVDKVQKEGSQPVIVREGLNPQQSSEYVNGLITQIGSETETAIIDSNSETIPRQFYKDCFRNREITRINDEFLVDSSSFADVSESQRIQYFKNFYERFSGNKQLASNAMKLLTQGSVAAITFAGMIPFFNLQEGQSEFDAGPVNVLYEVDIKKDEDKIKIRSKFLIKIKNVGEVTPLRVRWMSEEMEISKDELQVGKAQNAKVTRHFHPFFETAAEAHQFAFDNGLLSQTEFQYLQTKPVANPATAG